MSGFAITDSVVGSDFGASGVVPVGFSSAIDTSRETY
jgi:hypothetical protein